MAKKTEPAANPTESRPEATPHSVEIAALRNCVHAMEILDPESTQRVLDYLTDRFITNRAEDKPVLCKCALCRSEEKEIDDSKETREVDPHKRNDRPSHK